MDDFLSQEAREPEAVPASLRALIDSLQSSVCNGTARRAEPGPFHAPPPGFRSGFAVLWGKPNVGKSTLLNALLKEKVAIVSQKPQTTRNRIVGILNVPGGQVVFVDTPGIHQPKHRLGECLVETAVGALEAVELLLFVADLSHSPTAEDRQSAKLVATSPSAKVLVLNKLDLVSGDGAAQRREEYGKLLSFTDWVSVSATELTNLDQLQEKLFALLPEGPPYYPEDVVTDCPQSFMVAELIREQVLLLTHQEVPHSVAVAVEEIKPRTQKVTYVAANVFVEKQSQKRIVIGEKGQMLRAIGSAARPEIERYLGTRVYLELWVKVKEKWRRDERELRRLGYR